MIATMEPTYTYYFINMKFSLDEAMEIISCKAKLTFVKGNIYIYYVFLIKKLSNQ